MENSVRPCVAGVKWQSIWTSLRATIVRAPLLTDPYQLVAGYSKTTASGGLRVYMPDYGKISKRLTPAE